MVTKNSSYCSSDLNFAIEGLFFELSSLSNSAKNIYELICFNEEEIQLLEELITSYEEGIIMCHKYFYNILNFEEMCEDMKKANLKRFLLNHLRQFLPEESVEKYGSIEIDEEQEIDGGEKNSICKEDEKVAENRNLNV